MEITSKQKEGVNKYLWVISSHMIFLRDIKYYKGQNTLPYIYYPKYYLKNANEHITKKQQKLWYILLLFGEIPAYCYLMNVSNK